MGFFSVATFDFLIHILFFIKLSANRILNVCVFLSRGD